MHCRIKYRICHGFWCSLKIDQNEAKKLISWLIFGYFSFTPSSLLRPMRQASMFCQNEVLMKIHNRVKFHEYNICGCQVMISRTDSTSNKWLLWGGVVGGWALTSPNSAWFWWNFHQSRKRKRSVLKNLGFYGNGRYSKFALLV